MHSPSRSASAGHHSETHPLRTICAAARLATALLTLSLTAPAQTWFRASGRWALDTRIFAAQNIVGVFAGGSTQFIARADGTMIGWGYNDYRQCTLPPLPPGTRYLAAIANQSALGLRSDGSLAAWGLSLGLPPSGTFSAIAMGHRHAVALRSDGQIVAWGDNQNGQCNVPSGFSFVAVSAGDFHTGSIRSDGTYFGWGRNSTGQNNEPWLPPGLRWVAIAAGSNHSVGLRSDGAVLAWGWNSVGQCNVPPLPAGTTYTKVAANREHTFALRSDGQVVAFGDNAYGQINVPALPAGLRYVDVAASGMSGLALRSDGSFVAWGNEQMPPPPGDDVAEVHYPVSSGDFWVWRTAGGQLRATGSVETTLIQALTAPAGMHFTSVTAGPLRYLAVRSDGNIVGTGARSGRPVPPPPGLTYVAAASGYSQDFGLRSDGTVAVLSSGAPAAPALPPGLRYTAISAYDHGLALRSDGVVVAWGSNRFGETAVRALPPGLRYVEIQAGWFSSYARRSDGEIIVWGNGPAVPPLPPGVTYVGIGEHDGVLRRSDGTFVSIHDGNWQPPALPANEVYVTASGTALQTIARVGPASTHTSTYSRHGLGCAGSRATARLVPWDTPRAGRPLQLTALNLPNDVAVLITGFAVTQPIELSAVGMPSCWLRTSIDVTTPLVGQNGTADVSVTIPAGLAGLAFQQQAFVPDRGAGNSLGAVMSDAVTGVVGQ